MNNARRLASLILNMQLIWWTGVAQTKEGKSGNEERAQVDVWNCIRSTRGSDACGGKAVRSGVLLRRGVVTNLGYDVNDYAVMAKFFGNEVCVSYRSYTRSSDVSKCNEKCFSIYEDGGEEKETYRTKITCSSISCGGSIETLKFVATAKGRIVQYAPLLLILAPLFVLKLIAWIPVWNILQCKHSHFWL